MPSDQQRLWCAYRVLKNKLSQMNPGGRTFDAEKCLDLVTRVRRALGTVREVHPDLSEVQRAALDAIATALKYTPTNHLASMSNYYCVRGCCYMIFDGDAARVRPLLKESGFRFSRL